MFGPYTSFVHEMRGEILVQLEKYKTEEKRQDFMPWENEWRVLGWSIQRANELDRTETLPSFAPKVPERTNEARVWSAGELKEEELPVRTMQHFEQFFVRHVAPLQKGTQAFYSRSLDWLYKFLSTRFGQSFDWSMLDEETLVHFLSVWYLDHARTSPKGSRIFLNTLKHLFRWLKEEGIADVYNSYKRVYVQLIRSLPVALEAKKWLLEFGINPDENQRNSVPLGMYVLALSATGPVLKVEDRWIPVHLLGFPSTLGEHRLWVFGSIRTEASGCYFTRIEGVYPIVSLNEQKQVSGHK
jgi:hypothetical protein